MKRKGGRETEWVILWEFCRLKSQLEHRANVISTEHKTDLNARYSHDGKLQVPSHLLGT